MLVLLKTVTFLHYGITKKFFKFCILAERVSVADRIGESSVLNNKNTQEALQRIDLVLFATLQCLAE